MPNIAASPNSTPLRLKILRWELVNSPTYLDWVKYKAAQSLIKSALRGDDSALLVLGEAILSNDASVQQAALQVLRPNITRLCPQVLWALWGKTRALLLEELLRQNASPAKLNGEKETALLSFLLLSLPIPTSFYEEKYVHILVREAVTQHETIRANARMALSKLKKENAINELLSTWFTIRSSWLTEIIQKAGYIASQPVAVRVASCLLLNRTDLVLQMGEEAIHPLMECLEDPSLQEAANFCLHNLSNPGAIQEVCKQWAENRSQVLRSVLLESGYIPFDPPEFRLICALLLQRVDLASAIPPSDLHFLISYAEDQDDIVQKSARLALSNLSQKESRLALCDFIIGTENLVAQDAAIAGNYLPEEPEKRALFLFLTHQWREFDIQDFDLRLMRTQYFSADIVTRRRIARSVQISGRSDYLSILTQTQSSKYDAQEFEVLINILKSRGDFDELFITSLKAPITRSIEIINDLKEIDWQPPAALLNLFSILKDLTTEPILTDPVETLKLLPIAIKRANYRVSGRVNDLSFSRDDHSLAIATGSRKVILWDYRSGKKQFTHSRFDHSISQIEYLPDDSIVCAERTSQNAPCGIYHIRGGNYVRIGQHSDSVTALIPIQNDLVATGSNDGVVALWNLDKHQAIAKHQFQGKVRTGCVEENGTKLAWFTDEIQLMVKDTLELIPTTIRKNNRRGVVSSAARHAIFTPDNSLLLGQYNGQLIRYDLGTNPIQKSLVDRHNNHIVSLQHGPQKEMVVSADRSGLIKFHKPGYSNSHQSILADQGMITSLHISWTGHFMAVGSENLFTLWDLRPHTIPAVMTTPMQDLEPGHLVVINELLEIDLPGVVSRALQYLKTVIQYHFQYEVEISDMPFIQPGEFDILIEDIEND